MNQQISKKILFSVLFFMSFDLCLQATAAAQDDFVAPVLEDNSGHDKIINVMAQINHAVVPGYVDPIVYAQTANIDKDVNIAAIADFFQAKTVMGKAYLQETLSRPVSPNDQTGIIALRKNIIQQLIENPEFKAKVELILQNAAEQEKTAVEFMSLSFRNKTCPEFEQLKSLKDANDPGYSTSHFLLTNQTGNSILYGIRALALGIQVYNTQYIFDLLKPMYEYRKGYAAAQNKENIIGEKSFPFFNGYRHAELNLPTEVTAAQFGIVAACQSLVVGFLGYSIYQEFKACLKTNEKREKMHAINQLIAVAEDIEQLMEQNQITAQFKISLITDEQGLSLLNGLKASRYKYKDVYLFNPSLVDTFLYTVYENEAELAQIFASIAELDACNAIATKMIEAQKQESSRQFCFAQLLESEQPKVVAQDFWNVLVPNAVTNSLVQDQHIILTGPNAGGKTTSIRAILQNIVLAQTYGVAAGTEFAYTQFDMVLSYLNISDDLINGLSLFASEVKRAQELLEIIKNLPQGHKLFFALDELFTGTAAEAGEKIAYDFIKKTSTYNQTLFIYATHFDALKELGKQNIGLMNYQVNAPTKNAQGKLVYPFTLSPGASTVNVAMDMAKEANLFN